MADFVPNAIVRKLIFLYVLDKMDIPLTEGSIIDICTSKNEWLSYMDCKEIIWQLLEVKFIYLSGEGKEAKYILTYEGRSCLSHYFQRIPASIREEIAGFVKQNATTFKRSQEYLSDFHKVDDGTFMVELKIQDGVQITPALEIKIKTNSRTNALSAHKRWRELAPKIYEMLLANLFEE